MNDFAKFTFKSFHISCNIAKLNPHVIPLKVCIINNLDICINMFQNAVHSKIYILYILCNNERKEFISIVNAYVTHAYSSFLLFFHTR